MIDDTAITSEIILKGFVVTEDAELIKDAKKAFPNHYVQKHMKVFFFMDLDRIISVEPFYYDGFASIEYVRLFFKPSVGDLKHRITRIITIETFEEIKELLIKRNRYDILLNLDIIYDRD